MDRIADDPVFAEYKDGIGNFWWKETGPAAEARRAALHAQYRDRCAQREQELAEKFGTFQIGDRALRREMARLAAEQR
jgi:hypothetical protein